MYVKVIELEKEMEKESEKKSEKEEIEILFFQSKNKKQNSEEYNQQEYQHISSSSSSSYTSSFPGVSVPVFFLLFCISFWRGIEIVKSVQSIRNQAVQKK